MHASSISMCYMVHLPLAIQLYLCLALVVWSHCQQMPKPTTNGTNERLWKAEAIGAALAVAGGDTALAWQWQRVRLQSQSGSSTGSTSRSGRCNIRQTCCMARHAHTHDHGHAKRKVMPPAYVYHTDTWRNTPVPSFKTGGWH